MDCAYQNHRANCGLYAIAKVIGNHTVFEIASCHYCAVKKRRVSYFTNFKFYVLQKFSNESYCCLAKFLKKTRVKQLTIFEHNSSSNDKMVTNKNIEIKTHSVAVFKMPAVLFSR